MVNSGAFTTASVVATLPTTSLAKPAAISKVSRVAPPYPVTASKDVPLPLVKTMVRVVPSVTFTELISPKTKLTLPVVLSSPSMSQDNLVQSSRPLMLVLAVSPTSSKLL